MKGRAGFTLIELMIAVAIIGLAAALAWSPFEVFGKSDTVGGEAARVSDAQEVLAAAVETWRAAPFAEVAGLVGEERRSHSEVPGVDVIASAELVTPDLVRLRLVAVWETRGRERSLPLETFRGALSW